MCESIMANLSHSFESIIVYRSEGRTFSEGRFFNLLEGGGQRHRLERPALNEYAIRKVDDSFRDGHSLKG